MMTSRRTIKLVLSGCLPHQFNVKNNRYKVGTHASFYFQLIISQMIELTQWVTHTIK